ncbi:MAG: TRAP transporter small permease [Rhodospirillales bacterium]|jgi:TRAP-type C4-dicarboxylate transport system permease small subunit|nr:TRAP transporter small permease [Rhodospirillales bacterium]
MADHEKTPESEQGADRVLDLIDRVVRPLALYLGGTIIIVLCLLTVTAVGFRYVLNSPIFGVRDIAQLLLLTIVTFSVGQSGRTGSQVAVELLGTVTSPKFTRWTDAFVKILGAIMMGILTVQLVANGLSAAEYGEASNSLVIPFGPFFYLLAFGMALYGIVLLFEIYVHLRGGEVVHHVGTMDDL